MLLYAQPLSRILRLSAGDLSRDDAGQTWLRLGDPPSPVPVPPPLGALLHQLAATRHDHIPANHGNGWLFPGRHAGQPAAYRGIAALLREHGLPLRTARISALRQLVLAVPAPRHRRRPRVPPHHHLPAPQGRRTVEPVRRRLPRTLTGPGAGSAVRRRIISRWTPSVTAR